MDLEKMTKINWVDKISNEEVLAQVNETRTMLNSISARNIVRYYMFCSMMNYFVTLWTEEWLENL